MTLWCIALAVDLGFNIWYCCYCPDYVLNAGGIINVAAEVSGTYKYDWVDGKLENIKVTLQEIFDRSDKLNRPTNEIANEMARERLVKP